MLRVCSRTDFAEKVFFHFAFCLSVAAALAVCAAAGCTGPRGELPSPVSMTTARSRGGDTEKSRVRLTPEYRRATTLFAGHDYAGALSQIDTLLARPALISSDRAYLLRQKEICERAVSGKAAPSVVAAVSAPVAVAPSSDCGPRALLLACQQLDVPAALPALRTVAGMNKDGTTMAGLAKAAHSVGLKAEGVQMDRDALATLKAPAALAWFDGNHYVAVLSVNGDSATGTATIHDPNQPREEEMPLTTLLSRSGGVLLTLKKEQP